MPSMAISQYMGSGQHQTLITFQRALSAGFASAKGGSGMSIAFTATGKMPGSMHVIFRFLITSNWPPSGTPGGSSSTNSSPPGMTVSTGSGRNSAMMPGGAPATNV